MTNEKNTIKSADVVAPKKTPVKKVVKEDKPVADATTKDIDPIVVYFQTGVRYITASGIQFDEVNKMHELPFMEANLLLRLDNFRLANDEEKEMYYNTMEG